MRRLLPLLAILSLSLIAGCTPFEMDVNSASCQNQALRSSTPQQRNAWGLLGAVLSNEAQRQRSQGQ